MARASRPWSSFGCAPRHQRNVARASRPCRPQPQDLHCRSNAIPNQRSQIKNLKSLLCASAANWTIIRKQSPLIRKQSPLIRKRKPLIRKRKPLIRKRKALIRKRNPLVFDDFAQSQRTCRIAAQNLESRPRAVQRRRPVGLRPTLQVKTGVGRRDAGATLYPPQLRTSIREKRRFQESVANMACGP